MRAGLVHLNGVVPKPAIAVEEGDVLEYEIPERAVLETLPEDIALSITYEDDDLLVVDKPAGMRTRSSRTWERYRAIRCGPDSSIGSIAIRRGCSSLQRPKPRFRHWAKR
jgi:hypothetical protein